MMQVTLTRIEPWRIKAFDGDRAVCADIPLLQPFPYMISERIFAIGTMLANTADADDKLLDSMFIAFCHSSENVIRG